MKTQKKHPLHKTMSYNDLVQQAYHGILKQAEQLLASLEEEELRYVLERNDDKIDPDRIVHELVSPLLYVRLECAADSKLAIHFGIEPVTKDPGSQAVTATFLRILFTQTSKAYTGIMIEDCVKTDWLVNMCSEMFEYIQERNKYHTFRVIPYKKHPARKRVLKVA
jgi:hypothetical protein